MRATLGFFGAVALTAYGCATHQANGDRRHEPTQAAAASQKAPPPPPPIGQLDESGRVAIVEKFRQLPGHCDFVSTVDTFNCNGPNMTQCMASKVAAYGGNLLVLDGDRSLAYRCEARLPCPEGAAPC